MNLKKLLKISIAAFFVLPIFFLGNKMNADHIFDGFEDKNYQENLLACGGGGGGSSPADKKAAKAKKAKSKLMFKKRKLAEKAAAGEDTTKLESEIAELEAVIADANE